MLFFSFIQSASILLKANPVCKQGRNYLSNLISDEILAEGNYIY